MKWIWNNKDLNYKILRMKITVISSFDSRKFQDTLIGICYTFLVIHGVAFLPQHFLSFACFQHFYISRQTYPAEETGIYKINAGFWIFPVKFHFV